MRQTQWSPKPVGIVGCGAGGTVLAIFAVTLATDLPGRVLGGIAGLGLLVFAVGAWRARPKLAVVDDGLLIGGWWRARRLGRGDIARIRITEFRRIGRTVRLLEIETRDDALLLLSRWDLGTDPRGVLEALIAAGYPGR